MMMKYFFKVLLMGLLIWPASTIQAQYDHELKGELAAADEININHRRGSLRVLPSKDGKVSWNLRLTFDAKEKAEADKLINAISMKADRSGNQIDLGSQLPIEHMRTINNKSTLKLKDGTVIKNVRNIQITLLVYTPKVSNLRVENKYETIEVKTDVTNELEAVIYDGDLDIGDISGKLYLNAKYSKGKMGKASNSRIEMYDSKIEFGALGDLKLNAKYSTLRSPSIGSIEGEIYEGKIYVGSLQGKLQVNAKYSKFEFEEIKDGILDFYETDLIAGSAGDLQVKSKYSELRINKLNDINFESSYEDDLIIGDLHDLVANNSKYSDYDLGRWSGTLELKSYEDDIDIANPTSSISGIDIEGKYTKLNCILPSSLRYQIKLDAKYTNIDIGENDLTFSRYNKKGDTVYFEGKTNGATSTSPMLSFNCYDCKLNIQ